MVGAGTGGGRPAGDLPADVMPAGEETAKARFRDPVKVKCSKWEDRQWRWGLKEAVDCVLRLRIVPDPWKLTFIPVRCAAARRNSKNWN